MKKTRAQEIGELQARAILKMVDLMYQHRTACNFLKGLIQVLTKDYHRRVALRELSYKRKANENS
jgi:hypothetical protein